MKNYLISYAQIVIYKKKTKIRRLKEIIKIKNLILKALVKLLFLNILLVCNNFIYLNYI